MDIGSLSIRRNEVIKSIPINLSIIIMMIVCCKELKKIPGSSSPLDNVVAIIPRVSLDMMTTGEVITIFTTQF